MNTTLAMPLDQLLMIISSLMILGLMTGFLAGLLGIGAGAIIVPVLTELFLWLGEPEQYAYKLAVGSSLAIMIPTALRSFNRHRASGTVDTGLLKSLVLPILIGVITGAIISRYGSHVLLESIFAIVLFCMGLNIMFGQAHWRLGSVFPQGWIRKPIGFGIGAFSSIMGIGGGVFLNVLMKLFGASIHRAVATSSGVGLMIAIPGFFSQVIAGYDQSAALLFLSVGYVNLVAVLAIIPTSIITAPLGASVAHKLSEKGLSMAFGLFLSGVACRFIWRLVTGA